MAKTSDDLFEKSSMTFGEHLEELRVCLFRGVIGLGLGCVIGFFIADRVVRFFQSPLEAAMEKYYLDNAMEDFPQQYGPLTFEAKRMILDEKLVPELWRVDVGQLAQTLRLNYPDAQLAADFSPYWFTPGDFLFGGAKRIAGELVAGKGESNSACGRCWQLLSEEQRQTVQELSTGAELPSANADSTLLEILNSLASNKALHDSAEFAALAGFDSGVTSSITTGFSRLFGKVTQTAATDGPLGSVGSGRTALLQSAATLPGVSCPSSVVRSQQRIASSRAHTLASFLMLRFASSAARCSTATWSIEPMRGSRCLSGSSNPRGSAGAFAIGRPV